MSACKRSEDTANAPSAKRPPKLSGPTTAEAEQENQEQLLAGLYRLQPLTDGVAEIAPDGETWTRFKNGLMIHDLRPGSEGMPPRLGQTVTVAYVGTFPESGKIFDRRDVENPYIFTMGSKKLIEGFSLGIFTLRVGGKRRIFIPPDLGYGATGNPQGGIKGGQSLIFEVELLKISGHAINLPAEDVVPQAEPIGPPAPRNIPTTTPGTASHDARP